MFKEIPDKYISIIQGMLLVIRNELDRLSWNKYHKQMDSPFDNTAETYSNDTFSVSAYDWGWEEDKQKVPNFNYKDIFHVYWYKYYSRGIEAYYDENYNFDMDFLAAMLNNCISALRKDFNEESE